MQDSIVVQVQRVRRLSDRVVEYELASPDGRALPAFGAGAHVELHVPGFGARHYSCVRPWCEAGPYVIAVQRESAGRGGSAWLHDHLDPGATVEISTPRNRFPLAKDTTPKVLIAGGIGITPLLCMARELDEAGLPFAFIVCARDQSQVVYSEDLQALEARGRVRLALTNGDPATRFDFAAHLADLAAPTQVYCCGPESLMASVRDAVAGQAGVTLHTESFGASTDVAAPIGDDGPFTVACSDSGTTVVVQPGQSILDALVAAGVDVDHSCREGYCGTCLTRYTGGTPIHRDVCLSDEERERYVAVCVARAQPAEPLVLEL